MRIAIVDDIAKERSLLKNRLIATLKQYNVSADFSEYESGEDFLDAANSQPFTVVFLDIYLNGINGIETAKQLRTFDPNCLLIFTTSSTEHALEGFQVRAMHYLVKPYADEKLELLISEILSRIPKPDKYLDVVVNKNSLRLQYKDLVYAEHYAHMIYLHTLNQKTLVTRQTFNHFIAPLKEDSRFFFCSRGVVCNMEHALDFDGTSFLMKDGSSVLVNQSLRKQAHQLFMNYLFQSEEHL